MTPPVGLAFCRGLLAMFCGGIVGFLEVVMGAQCSVLRLLHYAEDRYEQKGDERHMTSVSVLQKS